MEKGPEGAPVREGAGGPGKPARSFGRLPNEMVACQMKWQPAETFGSLAKCFGSLPNQLVGCQMKWQACQVFR